MTHGTLTGYIHHACRCADCRKAWSTRQRAYIARCKAEGRCITCEAPAVPSRRLRDGGRMGMRCRKHADEHNFNVKRSHAMKPEESHVAA